MNGKHDFVSIQKAVECLVNQYDFDKSKINCMFKKWEISNSIFQFAIFEFKAVVCDEGSSLLKLFDQAHINICDDSINDDVFVNLKEEADNQNEDEPIARTESTSSGIPSDDEIQTFETVEAEITHLHTELN